eukprot:13057758-Heterocapsa_arctica.AAC.1
MKQVALLPLRLSRVCVQKDTFLVKGIGVKTKQKKAREDNKPECFWMAGIITSDWTTSPESEDMKATEVRHPRKGSIKKVCIDGSATNIEASCYAGWGLWTLDDQSVNGSGP